MARFLFLTFLLFPFTCILMAQDSISVNGTKPDLYERKLVEGIDAFYRYDWKQARTVFNDLKNQAPKDARAYFFDSMIPFWKYYFADNTPQAAKNFLKKSQKAIEIGQNKFEENPNDTTMVLMLSGLYGYQSLVAASENEYKTAIQSGMTGFRYTRQLLSLNSNNPNALIGKGMFYYMVGSVPNSLRWVTNVVGISGDKQEGLSVLEQAAKSESYVSNDAKMILAYLYQREGRYEKALPILKDLAQRYPKNIIFQYNIARVYEKKGNLTAAKRKYQKVLSMDAGDLQSLKKESEKRLYEL